MPITNKWLKWRFWVRWRLFWFSQVEDTDWVTEYEAQINAHQVSFCICICIEDEYTPVFLFHADNHDINDDHPVANIDIVLLFLSQSCINEWNEMPDISSRRPMSPDELPVSFDSLKMSITLFFNFTGSYGRCCQNWNKENCDKI